MFRRVASAAILGSALAGWFVVGAFATPNSGFTSVDVSKGRFEELAVNTDTDDANLIRLVTKGSSDFYVVENTVTPGGFSGWHTHPGPSLVTVKSGTFTVYHAKDCKARVYGPGDAFVELPSTVHVGRNETDSVVELGVVFFGVPIGGSPRIDQPQPTDCAKT